MFLVSKACLRKTFSLISSFAITLRTTAAHVKFRSISNCRMEVNETKPLNVLVYTGEDPANGNCPRYESIANNLNFCLDRDCYLVYILKTTEIFKDPWQENLKLLVISSDTINDDVAAEFGKYVQNGGSVFVSCTPLEVPSLGVICIRHSSTKLVRVDYKGFQGIPLFRSGTSPVFSSAYEVIGWDDQKQEVIFKLDNSGKIIISSVHLELDPVALNCDKGEFGTLSQYNSTRLEILQDLLSSEFFLKCSLPVIPKLTPCFLFSSSDNWIHRIIRNLGKNKVFNTVLDLVPVDFSVVTSLPEITEEELPVVYNFKETSFSIPFNKDAYFSHLKTSNFGQSIFFVEVVGSTMDVIYNLSDIPGCCVMASQQVRGRGRGNNKWISPVGCALFSLHCSLPLSSALGQKLPLIQQFVALSVILAVCKTPGYENINIRLKWPNDIYYGTKIKVGGVLVTSSIQGETANVFIGCGFNVKNSHPTLCLNDIIQFHNSRTGSNLPPFSIEQLTACTVSKFEELIKDFETDGPEKFFSAYYSYWLHDKQKVVIGATGEEVVIVGLDEYGFLLVENREGKKFSLHPDGNSFDIMKNLIIVK